MDLPGRLARVVPVAALVVLAPWQATRNDADDCSNIGTCLGQDLDQLVVWLPLLPVSWLAFRLLRVDSAALTTVAGGVYGALGWQLMRSLQRGLDPAADLTVPPPLWAALLLGVLAGALATVVMGSPGRGWTGVAVRMLVPLVLFGMISPLGSWREEQRRLQRVAEVAAAPVTLYRPVIAGELPRGDPSGDEVYLAYSIGEGADTTFPSVRLLPTVDGDLCDILPVTAQDCTSDDTTMRAGAGEFVEVAVVRGDTTLHATWIETRRLDVDEVLEALRTAPVVTADQLVS